MDANELNKLILHPNTIGLNVAGGQYFAASKSMMAWLYREQSNDAPFTEAERLDLFADNLAELASGVRYPHLVFRSNEDIAAFLGLDHPRLAGLQDYVRAMRRRKNLLVTSADEILELAGVEHRLDGLNWLEELGRTKVLAAGPVRSALSILDPALFVEILANKYHSESDVAVFDFFLERHLASSDKLIRAMQQDGNAGVRLDPGARFRAALTAAGLPRDPGICMFWPDSEFGNSSLWIPGESDRLVTEPGTLCFLDFPFELPAPSAKTVAGREMPIDVMVAAGAAVR